MSDTTSELRQLFEKTDGYAVELQKNGEPYNPDMYYLYKDVVAILAAERQRWEVAARKDELERLGNYKGQYEGRWDLDDTVADRIAALDGELGKEQ